MKTTATALLAPGLAFDMVRGKNWPNTENVFGINMGRGSFAPFFGSNLLYN